jgi:hypothetical protein
MLIRTALISVLFLALIQLAEAQTPLGDQAVPVEVVATASEYVPQTTTITRPGHAITNCLGNTSYFGQFEVTGRSGTVEGTAETDTRCKTTFTPPTETSQTRYDRVNYTIAKSGHALYMLSCTQH